jgi:hypothetical protein
VGVFRTSPIINDVTEIDFSLMELIAKLRNQEFSHSEPIGPAVFLCHWCHCLLCTEESFVLNVDVDKNKESVKGLRH